MVHTEDGFVHQLHRSWYSYLFTDNDEVVQDGMDCISRMGNE